MRSRRGFVSLAVVAVSGLIAAVPSVFGAPSPNASCQGAGASSRAPGQGLGDPGDIAFVAHANNAEPGSAGAFYSTFAQQHGSLEDCIGEIARSPPLAKPARRRDRTLGPLSGRIGVS
jgi:hypothetical protein